LALGVNLKKTEGNCVNGQIKRKTKEKEKRKRTEEALKVQKKKKQVEKRGLSECLSVYGRCSFLPSSSSSSSSSALLLSLTIN
jgi:hypothetical protein